MRTFGVATFCRAAVAALRGVGRRECFGHLEVGGVVVAVGERDRVLARVREHVEFLRRAAADAARVRAHGAELELQALEDRGVGAVHGLVTLLERGVVEVERVRVLHRELARAHHAEARPDLVAELGLDLVEIDRQLAVALQLAARDVGDHFLVRRAVAERAVVPVLDAQQLRAELVPAAGFDPQLGGLHGRHQHFERAGAVHLLADDGLDLAQHAQADRQPRVHAAGEAADQAGAQHQLVADDLGIGGNVAQGSDGIGRESHFASGGQKKTVPWYQSAPTTPASPGCTALPRCANTPRYLSWRPHPPARRRHP